jgi:FkbM family methyltransferase
MLITYEEVINALSAHNIKINGSLHIGAHECEELDFYAKLGVKDKIIWIDALQNKVDEAKAKNISNIYQAVITDKDDDTVTFNITNNVQSSSILDFGSHSTHHPHVHFVNTVSLSTITIDTFFNRNGIDGSLYDFWNIDIQGAELLALKGGMKSLHSVKALYLEVNTEEVYKGCAQLHEIDNFLSTYGLKRVLTKVLEFGWGDALYLKV